MAYKYDPNNSIYTKEMIEAAAKQAISKCDMIRKLGLKPCGSANSKIKSMIEVLNLDTSHFLGIRANQGNTHKGGHDKLSWDKILVYDRCFGRKEPIKKLRWSLIKSGIKEQCEKCNVLPLWQGNHLRLQIDHKNGDCLDNRPENLRFLCPNCHSQTPNFGSLNISKSNKKEIKAPVIRKKRIWINGWKVTVKE